MLFILSSLIILAQAEFSCLNTNASYKTGDLVTICVYLSSTNFTLDASAISSGPYIAFQSKLDTYSAVRLNNSYTALHSSSNCSPLNTTDYTNCSMSYSIVLVSDNSVQTPAAPYLKDTLVAIVFSAVVTMESGKVTMVEWDNSCDMCNAGCLSWNNQTVCADNECAMGSEGDCDPRVYVSWIGTDSDGNNLLSAGYRMSQFRQYSIFQMYSDAKGKF